MCVCVGRRQGVFLAPNVSLSRQPFIRLQQQLKLQQRSATSATRDDYHSGVTTSDDVDDDMTDTQSISSDRRKRTATSNVSFRIFTESRTLILSGWQRLHVAVDFFESRRKSGGFTQWRHDILFPCSFFVAWNARTGYMDHGCPRCLLPMKNFTPPPREIYGSGGGLLVTQHLLYQI